jgi:hypothetical protein
MTVTGGIGKRVAGIVRDYVRAESVAAKRVLVHQVRDWYSSVAIKMGRRQGATKEHI